MIKAYASKKGSYWKEKRPIDTEGEPIIFKKKKQILLGLGGAITKASAYNYALLDEENKKLLLNLYYSSNGLDYNLSRLSIGSNDFSPYIYDDINEDGGIDLKNEEDVLSLLDEANKMNHQDILLSSWSPLAKWKDNLSKEHGGHLKEENLDECARYYASVAKSLLKRGYDIQYLSPQNEPEAKQIWESCLMDEKEEGKLALKIKKLCPELNLLLWDHNRDVMLRRVSNYKDEALKMCAGFAYHWYDGDKHKELAKVRERHKNKLLLQTEACVELLLLDKKEDELIGRYTSFERYYQDHVKDLLYGSNGFIDWNILLDDKGGPNHVGNYCEAPIMRKGNKIFINPSYYALKHLSRVVKKNKTFMETNELQDILIASSVEEFGKIAITLSNNRKNNAIITINEIGLNYLLEPKETITVWEENE